MSPGILLRLIHSHLHIAENVVKPHENGHDILVSGGAGGLFGALGLSPGVPALLAGTQGA